MLKITDARRVTLYVSAKQGHTDKSILLFWRGSFFEAWFDDAKILADVLDITLTELGEFNGHCVYGAAIPQTSLNLYLGKLLKRGHTVVFIGCEQPDPEPGK